MSRIDGYDTPLTRFQIIEGPRLILSRLHPLALHGGLSSNTRWLTPEEQLVAAQRLAYDGLGNVQGASGRITEKEAFRMVVKDWSTWILALLYALVTGAQTIQYFIPTLVKSSEWTSWDGQCKFLPSYCEKELIAKNKADHAIPPYSCCGLYLGHVFYCRF